MMMRSVDCAPFANLSVKNTFLEEKGSPEEGLQRSSSCPALGAAPGSQPRPTNNWADLSSDDEGEDELGWQCPGSLTGQIERAPAPEEKKQPPQKAAEEARTPLRSTASTFIPLRSSAALFVPGSPPQSPGTTCGQQPEKASLAAPFAHVEIEPAGREERTTVMMRNLPCGLWRSALIWLLDKNGFDGKYDFVYLPIDFKKGSCLGYGFLNLTSVEHALRFTEVFDGFSDWPIKCMKVCAVSWSETQGLDQNVERYRNSPVMGDQVPDSYKPVIFADSKRVPFARPTRMLRPIMHRN